MNVKEKIISKLLIVLIEFLGQNVDGFYSVRLKDIEKIIDNA